VFADSQIAKQPVQLTLVSGSFGGELPMATDDLFRARLDQMIDMRHPLAVLATAIEPTIRHTKHDHGMKRCWLKGSQGDALRAVLCAAGFNIRWLLRAIARLGLAWLCLALAVVSWWVRWTMNSCQEDAGDVHCGCRPLGAAAK
jgi:hypothetical protein